MTEFKAGQVKALEGMTDWLYHQLEAMEADKHDPSIFEAMQCAEHLRLCLRAINAGRV